MSKTIHQGNQNPAVPVLLYTNNSVYFDKFIEPAFKAEYQMKIKAIQYNNYQSPTDFQFAFLDPLFFPVNSMEINSPVCCLALLTVDETDKSIISVIQSMIQNLQSMSFQTKCIIVPFSNGQPTKASKFHKKIISADTKAFSYSILEPIKGPPYDVLEDCVQFISQQTKDKLTQLDQQLSFNALNSPQYIINRLSWLRLAYIVFGTQIVSVEIENIILNYLQQKIEYKIVFPINLDAQQLLGMFYLQKQGKFYFEVKQKQMINPSDFLFEVKNPLSVIHLESECSDNEMQQKVELEILYGKLVQRQASDCEILMFMLQLLGGLHDNTKLNFIIQCLNKILDRYTDKELQVMTAIWSDYFIIQNQNNIKIQTVFGQRKLNAIIQLYRVQSVDNFVLNFKKLQNSVNEILEQTFKKEYKEIQQFTSNNYSSFKQKIQPLLQSPLDNIFMYEPLQKLFINKSDFSQSLHQLVKVQLQLMENYPDFMFIYKLLEFANEFIEDFKEICEELVLTALQLVRHQNYNQLQLKAINIIVKQLYALLKYNLNEQTKTNIKLLYFSLTADQSVDLNIQSEQEQRYEMLCQEFLFQKVELMDCEQYFVDNSLVWFSNSSQAQRLRFDFDLQKFSQFKNIRITLSDISNDPKKQIKIYKFLNSGEINYDLKALIMQSPNNQYFYLSQLEVSTNKQIWFNVYKKHVNFERAQSYVDDINNQTHSGQKREILKIDKELIVHFVPCEHKCTFKLMNQYVYKNCKQNLVFQAKVDHAMILNLRISTNDLQVTNEIELSEQQQVQGAKESHLTSTSFDSQRHSTKTITKTTKQLDEITFSCHKGMQIVIPCYVLSQDALKIEFRVDIYGVATNTEVEIKPVTLFDCKFYSVWNMLNIQMSNTTQKCLSSVQITISLNDAEETLSLDEVQDAQIINKLLQLQSSSSKISGRIRINFDAPEIPIPQPQTPTNRRESFRMSSASFVLEQLNTELYDVEQFFSLQLTDFSFIQLLNPVGKQKLNSFFKVNFRVQTPTDKTGFFTFCLKNDVNFVVQGETEFKMGEHEDKIVEFDCAGVKSGVYEGFVLEQGVVVSQGIEALNGAEIRIVE
ncbi:Conserved_hypothetical protein [Hexamita inflata]|uniref:Uncharacterized protein n=1 Tax=Hexamita inflata TaxID=28002 RepID=A0AA86Q363_9EUKA|nr:Conserved hypothetical protein [Hexamita inflata]